MSQHPTFCRLCEAYCGIVATVADGRAVDIKPDRDNPQLQGHVCVKGIAMTALTNDPDRLLRPMKRVGGQASSRRRAGTRVPHTGNPAASCPRNCRGNILVLISLMRWECNGLIAYGDDQSFYCHDYVNLL